MKQIPTVGLPRGFSIEKAHEKQLQMSKKIIQHDMLPKKIRNIAGVDVAYSHDLAVAAVALLRYSSLKLLESKTALCRALFPYVPTLFAYREEEPVLRALGKLHLQPEVVLVDGHGVAHPYRCGLASQLGLVIHRPTIGVAKSRLFGTVHKGNRSDFYLLEHDGETVGGILCARQGCKEIYVSVGHMVSLETSIAIVRHCTPQGRTPEPIRIAHQLATAERQRIRKHRRQEADRN